MVDRERIVKLVPLAGEELHDVAEGVVADVEVAGHAHRLDESLQPAPLLFLKLSHDSVRDVSSVRCLFVPALCR